MNENPSQATEVNDTAGDTSAMPCEPRCDLARVARAFGYSILLLAAILLTCAIIGAVVGEYLWLIRDPRT